MILQVVLVIGHGSSRQEACSNLTVPTCKWSRLYISHTPHKLRKSEAVFYLDNLKSEAAIKFPSATNLVRIYAGCSGCHAKATPATEAHGNFKGLLGAVRVFDEPVSINDIPSERFGPDTCACQALMNRSRAVMAVKALRCAARVGASVVLRRTHYKASCMSC